MNTAARTFVIGAAALAPAMFAWAQGEAEVSDLDVGYPVVITPTRLRQPLADVPASVTVLTAEMMQRYGIHSVVDAMRLVPGMEITQVSGNDARINYHGTNVLVPRRMNVLIDGVSAYRPGVAQVDWSLLPVAMEDIERIEVTRGPDSVAYGPNSMLAIINIITKHPIDVGRGMTAVNVGSSTSMGITGRLAASMGDTRLRLTFERQRDSGYDTLTRSSEAGGHDSTEVKRLGVRSETVFGNASSLQLQAWWVQAIKEVPFVDAYQITFPDQHVNDYYLDALWKTALSPEHELQFRLNHSESLTRQSWVTCIPTATALPQLYDLWRANPVYANQILAGRVPSGGSANDDALAAAAIAAVRALGAQARSPLCVNPNQDLDQSRTDLELQDTLVLHEGLRVVSGAGVRTQHASSQTYLDGGVTNELARVFANAEYKPAGWLGINAGGYWEDDRLASRSTFSPRLAFNLHWSDNQTVRLIYSRGARSPDIYEQRVNWAYAFEAPRPVNGATSLKFFQSAQSPGGLQAERITSREVGYLLRVSRLGLLFDLKVFDDELSELLSQKLQVSDFHPTNGNSVHLSGAEFQASMEVSKAWSGFFNYAYLDNRDASALTELTQYSRQSGALGVSYAPQAEACRGWRVSLDYVMASGNGLDQSRYGRTDLTLAKTFTTAGKEVRIAATMTALDSPTVTTFRDFSGANPVLVSRYDSRLRFFGQVMIGF